MSDHCPICNAPTIPDELSGEVRPCPHYVLEILDEDHFHTGGAPLWTPTEYGEFSSEIKQSLDALFQALCENPFWVPTEPSAYAGRDSHLATLLRGLRTVVRDGLHEDLDHCENVEGGGSEAFNRYVLDVYRGCAEEDRSAIDIVNDRPGFQYQTVYLWSEDPAATSACMIRAIRADLAQIQADARSQ